MPENTAAPTTRKDTELPRVDTSEDGTSSLSASFTASWSRCKSLTLLAQYLNVTFTAVMLGALFDAYLLIKGGSNAFVGTLESARGITALACALPVGWAGDKWPKAHIFRINVCLGAVAAIVLIIGVPTDNMYLVFPGVIAYAIHNQCLFALLPAALAEMTQEGEERTRAISNLQAVGSLGNASGPAVQIVMMLLLGKTHWELGELHWALCVGFIFFVAYAPLMVYVQASYGMLSVSTEQDQPQNANSARLLQPASDGIPKRRWLIAGFIETASFITAIGSGMTFKYWPLFFKGDFGFNPIGVCIMQLAIWLAISGSAKLAPGLARKIGRLQAVLLLHVLGTFLLFLISWQSLGAGIEVPLVLLRNAIMNGGTPLVQALILDLVPQQHRGKWSSIASLRRMTWSGSAFVGGILSDSHDYRFAFFITACVHSIAGFLIVVTKCLQDSPWTSRARDPPDMAARANSFYRSA